MNINKNINHAALWNLRDVVCKTLDSLKLSKKTTFPAFYKGVMSICKDRWYVRAASQRLSGGEAWSPEIRNAIQMAMDNITIPLDLYILGHDAVAVGHDAVVLDKLSTPPAVRIEPFSADQRVRMYITYYDNAWKIIDIDMDDDLLTVSSSEIAAKLVVEKIEKKERDEDNLFVSSVMQNVALMELERGGSADDEDDNYQDDGDDSDRESVHYKYESDESDDEDEDEESTSDSDSGSDNE